MRLPAKKLAITCPKPIIIWNAVIRRPRICEGAVSPTYMGTIIEAIPVSLS